nr:MAG TPA: hypothetical protein [Caudoviricetes sp.]
MPPDVISLRTILDLCLQKQYNKTNANKNNLLSTFSIHQRKQKGKVK